MCLESKRLFPRRAKKDIVVGKVLSLTQNNEVVTYYQRYPVHSLEMKEKFSLFTVLKMFISKIRYKETYYTLEGGMIHSYNFCNMEYFRRQLFETGTFEYTNMYVKAVIPKGALYYIDRYGTTYASNILILKPTKEQLKYFKCNG